MKIPYDDYNSKICWSKVLGTLTTEAPRTAFRHGHKIIEIYNAIPYQHREQ